MRARVFIITKVLALTVILSALAIYYPSPSMVNAQCSTLSEAEIRVNQGLITAVDQAPFYQGTNVYCVAGSGAIIPINLSSVKTYADMKTLYFDQAKTTITKITLPAGNKLYTDIVLSNYQIYRVTGNLTLNGEIPVSRTGVIFVDGNLYINSKLTQGSATSGLVFIVQGGIYISRSIGNANTIDAFLISYGKAANGIDNIIPPFCSAWDGSACTDYTDWADELPLTINGSVISLNSSIAPEFNRRKADINDPGETINFQPKYLIILKDIFSRDQKTWREIQ